jgi:phenylpropionate dioxygenase-like ring-hydroxylating dioxygenase large terminal subunit
MIKNQWYVVLESDEVRERPVGFLRMNESLIFWRDRDGKVICFKDKCSHRGIALSKGEIVGDHLQCPFHGLEFDSTGRCVLIPANGKSAPREERFDLKNYETYEKHGLIWIFWGEKARIESEPAYFDDLSGIHYATVQDHWGTHYSRVIENQLDCAHLPFIHKKTIGKGNRTLVDGPLLVWKGSKRFLLYVFNKSDDGSRPLKPEQLQPKPEGSQHLEFIFPNLWQNYILPKMRILAAFVPVDEENTLMYIRFYQDFVRFSLFRRILNLFFIRYNLKIAHEDRRVVTTHDPKRTHLRLNENLFPADRPIIEYRKMREDPVEKVRE